MDIKIFGRSDELIKFIMDPKTNNRSTISNNEAARGDAWFKTVVENMTDMLIVVNTQGDVDYISPSVVKILGYPYDEILGKSVLRYLHPVDVLLAQKALNDIFQKPGFSAQLDVRIKAKDGTWKHLHTSGTLITASDVPNNIVIVAHDTTNYKANQDVGMHTILSSAELIERLNMGIFRVSTDIDGHFIDVNQGFLDMFEAESKEVLFSHVVADIYQDSKDIEMMRQQALADGFIKNQEIALKTLKGKEIWGAVTLILETSDAGVSSFNGLIIDISLRKKAEERLRKLTRAVEQSPESIVITDLDGNIEYVNPTFEKNTGYTLKEVMGKNPRILQSGNTPKETYTELWKAILAGQTWYGELQNKKKNGDLYWESAVISGVTDEYGKVTGFLAVKQDVTAMKQYQEQLEARTRESERMNALMVGRELRMMELKQEIATLKAQIISQK